jgi:prophage regulatory protein
MQQEPVENRLVRVSEICGCPKKGLKPLIAISRSSWFAGCRSGKFPAGKLLGPRTRCWEYKDILSLISDGVL